MRNMNSNSAVESDNHADSLDEVEADQSGELNPQHPRPDRPILYAPSQWHHQHITEHS